MSSRAVAITTYDNPYDPLDDFSHWYGYDCLKGYNTCQYLARIAATASTLPDSVNEEEIESAIDEIIKYNPLKIYKKVVHE